MHRGRHSDGNLVLAVALLLVGCTVTLPTVPPPATLMPAPAIPPRVERSHLTIGVDEDFGGLAPWLFPSARGSGVAMLELYHSTLATLDEQGRPVPRLAAALPSLDDGTWQVFADGTMVTTYRLRPDVRWQDGAALTADDVALGFELNRLLMPAERRSELLAAIDGVEGSAPETLVVHWRRAHWAAGAVREELAPQPRHLLRDAVATGGAALTAHPFWTTAYVGLGPFRVTSFAAEAGMELARFDDYYLGRPRLETISIRRAASRQELMVGLQSGGLDVVLAAWGAPEAVDMRAIWEANGMGTIITYPSAVELAWFLPATTELDPPHFRDPTFRTALAVALNRQQTGFAASLGLAPPPVTWIPPADPRWEQARPYVHDELAYNPARAFRLLREVGWTRDADGLLRDTAGRELVFDLAIEAAGPTPTSPSVASAGMQSVVARYWSEIGARLNLVSGTANGQPTPGRGFVRLAAAPLGPESIARSLARGGATASDTGDLAGRYLGSLRLEDRLGLERELVRATTRDVPLLTLGFRVQSLPVAQGVTGLRPRTGLDVQPWVAFNAHEWALVN